MCIIINDFYSYYFVGQKDKLRLIFLQYILKLPVFGDFLRKFYLVNIVNQLIFYWEVVSV